jgi:uncharacterized protein (DUF2345 family)
MEKNGSLSITSRGTIDLSAGSGSFNIDSTNGVKITGNNSYIQVNGSGVTIHGSGSNTDYGVTLDGNT